ncbi:protein of unknown function [Paraburkholderia kururiensis]
MNTPAKRFTDAWLRPRARLTRHLTLWTGSEDHDLMCSTSGRTAVSARTTWSMSQSLPWTTRRPPLNGAATRWKRIHTSRDEAAYEQSIEPCFAGDYPGAFTIKAAAFTFVGPDNVPAQLPVLPKSDLKVNDRPPHTN